MPFHETDILGIADDVEVTESMHQRSLLIPLKRIVRTESADMIEISVVKIPDPLELGRLNIGFVFLEQPCTGISPDG